uniref:hypothetical protein n=1 Tax=Stappia sp. TaxID=1870903 RepID=UPI003BAB0DE2
MGRYNKRNLTTAFGMEILINILSRCWGVGAMSLEIARKTYRLKYVIVFLFLTIVCLALIVSIALFLPANSFGRDVAMAMVSSVTVASILGLVYEYFLREDIMKMNDASSDRVIEKICVENFSREIGLSGVFANANAFNYSNFLLHSKSITIVMNDGRTWVSNHESDIEDRLKRKGFKTRFVLINPDSPFLESLALKIGTTKKALAEKIRETTETLLSHCEEGSDLTIYYHKFPTTFSLYMCDERARLVTYPMARKADKVPLVVFKKGNEEAYYHSIERDVAALIKASEQVYPELPLLKSAKR